jgi:hypothetical protein
MDLAAAPLAHDGVGSVLSRIAEIERRLGVGSASRPAVSFGQVLREATGPAASPATAASAGSTLSVATLPGVTRPAWAGGPTLGAAPVPGLTVPLPAPTSPAFRPPGAAPSPGPVGPVATAPPAPVGGAVKPGPVGDTLGPDRLTPQARYLRDLIRREFGVHNIGGWRAVGSVPGSDHPHGRALDVMVPKASDRATGDRIASWAKDNADALHVKYVIWRQRVWSADRADEGWRPMKDRGNPTLNHYDHVHISTR